MTIDALAMTTAAPRGVVARSTALSSRRSSLVSCVAPGGVALVVTVSLRFADRACGSRTPIFLSRRRPTAGVSGTPPASSCLRAGEDRSCGEGVDRPCVVAVDNIATTRQSHAAVSCPGVRADLELRREPHRHRPLGRSDSALSCVLAGTRRLHARHLTRSSRLVATSSKRQVVPHPHHRAGRSRVGQPRAMTGSTEEPRAFASATGSSSAGESPDLFSTNG